MIRNRNIFHQFSYSGSDERGYQVAFVGRNTKKEQNQQTFYYSKMSPKSKVINGCQKATPRGRL